MKIQTKDLIDNWSYWTNERRIMGYDVFIELDGQKYEVSTINRARDEVKYLKNNEIYTLPLSTLEFIIVEGEMLGYPDM